MLALSRKLTTAAAVGALALGGMVAFAPTASAEDLCNHISDSSRPTVYVNQDGPATKQVQCLINYYSGFPTWLTEDGDYGTNTYNGIKWVQRCNGLQQDGIVGSNTWSRLYSPKAACK
ncbi:peptidoglycan-binding domain-containing protein [Streptomyces sp. ALI-76-A]|jgi:peptidoglycan hydrolase-like protein with peptidoglycan-binding domain|uniref:peptidoglycan-binding domain-containing protein n=1 Tax=Streptomyces sp. ALI-76-A TaxID=3025736 RepID=UPI00256F2A5B|nr:peptidoglycan-binding domain-containing protein [Streptomyces sp. ALI-76-A]MDL5206193.1 peptidoglycan-binding domain-containing protein [Streptomyces sp. ALI-76-A]